MHSVFVHFSNVTRLEIAEYLDHTSVKGLREHWYFPNRNDPVFSIRFPNAGSDFRDDANKQHVVAAMGDMPDLTIQIDVGGKHPGHKELRSFLTKLLGEYSGVALDGLLIFVNTRASIA